ncbi:MAG: hypothetical protein HXY50_06280 [Ignavibacteriaceae bacterium]|nr:hypothetical protein [Ignavibacteriaceae bacterium]
MKDLLNILKYRWITLNVILVLLSLLFSYYSVLTVPALFVLVSNLFDILGYHFTLIRRQNQLPEKEYVKSYRIIQLMFDITLVLLLGVTFGWFPALCGGVLKIFGVQDLLYYFFLKKPYPKIWTWLRWTPIGLIKPQLTLNEVIIQSSTGIFISYFFLLRHLNFF